MKIKPKHILWTLLALLIGGIAIVVVLFFGAINAFDIPGPDDIPLNKEEAWKLTKSFMDYEKIQSMDDATRCSKFLNGDQLSLSEFSDSNSDACNGNRPTLDSLLEKYEIEKSVYLEFRSKLEETKLRNYCRIDDLNVYIVGGWIDDVWGYCFSNVKLEVSNEQYRACNYTIQITEDLGDGWYLFWGN